MIASNPDQWKCAFQRCSEYFDIFCNMSAKACSNMSHVFLSLAEVRVEKSLSGFSGQDVKHSMPSQYQACVRSMDVSYMLAPRPRACRRDVGFAPRSPRANEAAAEETNKQMYIYIYIYVVMYVFVYLCYIYIYIYVYIYIYIYIYIFLCICIMYTYIYIYTCIL